MTREPSLIIALLLAFVFMTSAVSAQTAQQSDIDQLKAQIEMLKSLLKIPFTQRVDHSKKRTLRLRFVV